MTAIYSSNAGPCRPAAVRSSAHIGHAQTASGEGNIEMMRGGRPLERDFSHSVKVSPWPPRPRDEASGLTEADGQGWDSLLSALRSTQETLNAHLTSWKDALGSRDVSQAQDSSDRQAAHERGSRAAGKDDDGDSAEEEDPSDDE